MDHQENQASTVLEYPRHGKKAHSTFGVASFTGTPLQKEAKTGSNPLEVCGTPAVPVDIFNRDTASTAAKASCVPPGIRRTNRCVKHGTGFIALKWARKVLVKLTNKRQHKQESKDPLQTRGLLQAVLLPSIGFCLSPLEQICPVINSLKTNRGQ